MAIIVVCVLMDSAVTSVIRLQVIISPSNILDHFPINSVISFIKLHIVNISDPCYNVECKNGGNCLIDSISGNFRCVCKDRYYGDYCEFAPGQYINLKFNFIS